MRLGNGWIAELVEWWLRAYGGPVATPLHGVPAAQVALMFRCWSQGLRLNKSGTLMEDELWRKTSS